jgi:hypothetical protein
MELLEQSLNGSIKTYITRPSQSVKYDVELMLAKVTSYVIQTLYKESEQKVDSTSMKFQLALRVRFKKREEAVDGESTTTWRYVDPFFLSKQQQYDIDNVLDHCNDLHRSMMVKYDVFVHQTSGLTLDEILDYRLKVHHYKPFFGGGNTNNDPLPPKIKRTRACLNIRNVQTLCFVYACLAHLHPVNSHPELKSHYTRYFNELDLTGLVFPATLKTVKLFEKKHKHIAINVLGYEAQCVIPLYRTLNRTTADTDKQINLLLYRKHFYLIRSMSKLLNSTHGTTGTRRVYYCHSCLCYYTTQSRLEEHYSLCRDELQRLTVPDASNRSIRFSNYRHVFPLPFVIYFDSESLLVPDDEDGKTLSHVPISIACFTKCTNDIYSTEPKIFTGLNCVQMFLAHLEREERRIVRILDTTHTEMTCSDEDETRLRSTTNCDVCRVQFTSKCLKYRDHCHLSSNGASNIRYILCNRCNLTFGRQRSTCKIPIIAHNCNKYDIHHIVQHIRGASGVKILAKNSETFISMQMGKRLVFVDSLNFLSGSLDSLVALLPDAETKMYTRYITKRSNLHELLKSKGIFPYDYMDNVSKLQDKALPPIEKFHDKLSDRPLSIDDYQRAQKVWTKFGCNSMQEYMELYVCLDTLLLAAVFESYRRSTLDHFKLDPAHYVTSPSLCWDAMLKVTDVTLQTLPSVDMYLFFSNCIRGGITGTSTRHGKANNDFDSDSFDDSLPVSHILSYDVNNLYGMSLSQVLPTDNFRWMTADELKDFDVLSVPDDGDIGYFVEVDLQYPRSLHNIHNEFPLAPEKLDIPSSEWSAHTKHLASQLGMTHKSTGLKLMLTLRDKHRYTLHYVTLKLYLALGLKVTRIYKGVTFRQSAFMKTYISLNTEARKTAKSQFEVALYKGYNNYIFGKTCYNVFNQTNIKLVDDADTFQRLAAKPTFHTTHVVNETLTLVEMKPVTINCNKPVYIGCSVLELSKAHMYSFYYQYLIPMYHKTGLRMLYADTDSFYVQVFNRPDVYHDMVQHAHWFDRSSYPSHHFLHSDEHKREIGLMKDIHGHEGHVIEFVALRSKMYAVRVQNWYDDDITSTTTKAKGIHHSVMKHIPFSAYINTLKTNTIHKHRFVHISSKKHHLSTVESAKVGLCAYDDKRLLLSCGIHSYAYGHYRRGNQQCPWCVCHL